jgi:hypothetical protein
MSPGHSRRNFLKLAPATVALLSIARRVLAQNLPPGGPANPTSKQNSGSGGGFGGGMPPGPAAHNGDFDPGKVSSIHDKAKTEPPSKPRKDLAADQKSMREEVQQLVRDTQDLKNAVEQFGSAQQLSPELVGKTKEIEKLAHDIAALAKG